jgi:zinc transport system ATP-binding protein
MNPVIELKDIWVHYEDKSILEGINLIVKENDFLGIIGPNGGGKTTLLKVVLGLIKPNKGEVKIFGDHPKKTRNHIGYVPQIRRFDLEFPATVWDVVATGRLGHNNLFKNYDYQDKEIIKGTLEKVNMIGFKDEAIGKLSGGERQRVFIARALASEPKMLLLDEPTASVDKELDTKFWEFLNELKKKITIILVTHDISAVSVYVDKIACLNRRLYYQGTKEITPEIWSETYKCPVEMIAHGIPHRVVKEHK